MWLSVALGNSHISACTPLFNRLLRSFEEDHRWQEHFTRHAYANMITLKNDCKEEMDASLMRTHLADMEANQVASGYARRWLREANQSGRGRDACAHVAGTRTERSCPGGTRT